MSFFDFLFGNNAEVAKKQAVYWEAYAESVKKYASKYPTFPVIPPTYIPEVWADQPPEETK